MEPVNMRQSLADAWQKYEWLSAQPDRREYGYWALACILLFTLLSILLALTLYTQVRSSAGVVFASNTRV